MSSRSRPRPQRRHDVLRVSLRGPPRVEGWSRWARAKPGGGSDEESGPPLCGGLSRDRSHTLQQGHGVPTVTNSIFWDNTSQESLSFCS